MTTHFVANSIRRLDREYNKLTLNGNLKKINDCFHINNIHISLEKYTDESGVVINKITILIKRKTNYKINQKLLGHLFPEDISNRIMNDYFREYDTLIITINIEYDTLSYPFTPPKWKLISIQNDGFLPQTNSAVSYLIDSHNEILKNNWSCAIELSTDLNYFLSKLLKFMDYI